ncbi:MAG: restriction endonuclease subunit S [Chryseolinea sp.]
MTRIKEYKFIDLYEMASGISTKPEQAGHGSPFVSFSTAFNNSFLPQGVGDLMNTSQKEQEIYSLRAGDILLTRTSETIDELGMSCVVLNDFPRATYSGFLKRVRPIQNDITYPKFMGFYLRSKLFRKTMTNNAVLTLRASLNEEIFSYLKLYLPDYDTQKRVGDFLYSITSKIELNNRINAELEAMAKLIYDYWFVQFDFPISTENAQAMGNPNLEGKAYKASGGKMVWSEESKREIPEGWTVGTIKDLGEIIGGSTPSTKDEENFEKGGTPWITPKDLSLNVGNKYITKGEICVSKRGKEKASLKIMPTGTILLSSRAPIGYMAISRESLTTNQGFKNIVPNKGYSTEIVYYIIKNLMPVIKMNASGSTFQEISGSVLKSIKVLLPHRDHAITLTEILSPIFRKQNLLELEKQKLTEVRDWLLPMLMNCQVSIREAETEIAMAAEGEAAYGKRKHKY